MHAHLGPESQPPRITWALNPRLQLAPVRSNVLGMSYLRLTANKRQQLLEVLRDKGTFATAAEAVGMTTEGVRSYRKRHPDFDQECKEAIEHYAASLEHEAHRRAVLGTTRPVFYRGEEVGSIQEYSDRLLELMLKRHIPAFRDHSQVDMNVAGGVLVVPGVGGDSRAWEQQQRNADVKPTPAK